MESAVIRQSLLINFCPLWKFKLYIQAPWFKWVEDTFAFSFFILMWNLCFHYDTFFIFFWEGILMWFIHNTKACLVDTQQPLISFGNSSQFNDIMPCSTEDVIPLLDWKTLNEHFLLDFTKCCRHIMLLSNLSICELKCSIHSITMKF